MSTETSSTRPGAGPAQRDTALHSLLSGRGDIEFVGRSKLWLQISVALVLLCAVALWVRGLNFSIEFTGGSSFVVEGASASFTADDITAALDDLGITDAIVQVVADGRGAQVATPAVTDIPDVDEFAVAGALAEVTGVDADSVAVSSVGPRWGAQVTRQALEGLVGFLVLVVAYITVRFEWRMAVAAAVTLLHDLVVTVGLYALVGFTVSPASVIALLTILGYSLYDTVVVFDRVTEDSARLTSVSSTSYGRTANRALNEVLVRSLSTSITSVLPVGSLLFIGANLLGAETLQDLALALFIGMSVGTYSSIIVATPFLVWLKERDPKYAALKARAERRA